MIPVEVQIQDLQDRLDGANDLLDTAYDDLSYLAGHFLPDLTAEVAGMRLAEVVEAICEVLTVFESRIGDLSDPERTALARLLGAADGAFVYPKDNAA